MWKSLCSSKAIERTLNAVKNKKNKYKVPPKLNIKGKGKGKVKGKVKSNKKKNKK